MRTKKQKKEALNRTPNRKTRRMLLAEMMRGTPAEFLVQLYAKAFQLSPVGAMNDLKSAGVVFSAEEIARIQALEKKLNSDRERNKKSNSASTPELYGPEDYGVEFGWDDTYSFIAGFTSGGAAYGTTWEEARRYETEGWDQLLKDQEQAREEITDFEPGEMDERASENASDMEYYEAAKDAYDDLPF